MEYMSPENKKLGVCLAQLFISPKAEARHNNINFIRFLAATSVIFGHMGYFIDSPIPMFWGKDVSGIAVRVFFVLSGYLIFMSFERDPHVLRYLLRRCFRIFPALIVVVLFCALILGAAVTSLPLKEYYANPATLFYVINNITLHIQYFLPGVFEDNPYPGSVNGSLWTLPIEFSMYIVLMFILLCLKKVTSKTYPLVGIALVASALHGCFFIDIIQVEPTSSLFWIKNAFTLIPYFFWGAVYASSEKAMSALNLQVAFLILIVATPLTDIFPSYLDELVQMVFLPYITLAISFAMPPVFGRMFARNDYSYGLYVWAFPIQQTLVHYLGPTAFGGILGYSLACFAVTMPFAMASWFLVERPANNFGRKIIKKLQDRLGA